MSSDNGLGYCPCDRTKRASCGVCGRHLCGWHFALGPFLDGAGGVELAPVCLPACESPWWTQLPGAMRDNP